MWCDRCGSYAETRGRGLARPCRGAVAGGNRVGRPLRSVQARLRALRLGKHPVTGATIDAVLPPSGTGGSRSGHADGVGQERVDRERSRSRRRAVACKALVDAIHEGLPKMQIDRFPASSGSSGATQRTTVAAQARLDNADATRSLA